MEEETLISILGACLCVMALALAGVVVAAIFEGYLKYQDALVCKQQTGLYSGCELKQREQKLTVDVK